MKRFSSIVWCLVVGAAMVASAHVMDSAVYLFRGGQDVNGDGLLQSGEMTDSANVVSSLGAPTGGNLIAHTNEVVRCPFTGETITNRCLQFLQPIREVATTNFVYATNYVTEADVVTTNEVITTNITRKVYAKVGKVTGIKPFAKMSASCTTNYSMMIRFRREAIPEKYTSTDGFQDWLLRVGYTWNATGLAIGFNGNTMTNRNLEIFGGGQMPGLTGSGGSTSSRSYERPWTDLAIAVDGWNVKIWYLQENAPKVAERTMKFSYQSGKLTNLGVTPSTEVNLGGENESANAKLCLTAENNRKLTSDNVIKCFRGAVQQLAFWDHTLTDQEVREAFGYPHRSAVRVGLLNGKAGDFGGTATSVDGSNWESLNGILAPGDERTISFTRDGETVLLSQELRLVGTAASGAGLVKVTLNGTDVKTVPFAASRTNFVYVAEKLFVNGLNTLTLKNMGTEAVTLDGLSFEGSWILGRHVTGNVVWLDEGKAGGGTQWVDGGNTNFLWRGVTASSGTSYINLIFSMDPRLCRYDATYRSRIVAFNNANYILDILLNGNVVVANQSTAQGQELAFNLPCEYFVAGTNTLRIQKSTECKETYAWRCFSYHMLTLNKPNDGSFLILR